MKNETKQILAEMGFTSANSIASVRPSAFLGLDLSIKLNGTGSIVFCNGGMSEYLLLANHGATVAMDNDADPEIKTVGDGIPYLTISKYRFLLVLQSIAFNRFCLLNSHKGTKGGSLEKAKKLAKLWFDRIPREENQLYSANVTSDEMEAELVAS